MELIFIGADHEVTGSCHYLQVGSKKILVDYGMEQGRDLYENEDLPVKPSEIDYVFLTHAHIDHSGMLPALYHNGFRGEVICTPATEGLCSIMLRDAAHIQTMEAEWREKKADRRGEKSSFQLLYTMEDAIGVMKLFKSYPYDKKFTLCDGIQFRFTDIGHLLGSSSIELWLSEGGNEKKIVFSGDIGNKNQPLLRDPAYTEAADYVVVESTYGDRSHELTDADNIEELAAIISATLRRGGNVVIPSFAVGRTQVILYYIRQIKADEMIPDMPDFPVYVDSPLAVEATEIFYERGRECYDEEALALVNKGINPISFQGLHLTISTDESKAINLVEEPKVIISASGMCDAGRVKHHLKHNLWREECTVLFVGYQAEGSPGRKIVDGADSIKLFGEDVAVRAQIHQMTGLSGHADREGLLQWIGSFTEKPKQVFVVHGEDKVTDIFAEQVHEKFGLNAMAPYSGTRYDLASGKFIEMTKGIPIARAEGERRVSESYGKLKDVSSRLEDMIKAAKGFPNRDLERFARDLERIMEKYRR